MGHCQVRGRHTNGEGRLNDNYVALGLLTVLVSGTFVLTSTLDIPFYWQDVELQAVAIAVLILGALVTLAGFLIGRNGGAAVAS